MSVVIYRLYRWKRPIRSPSTPWEHRTVLQQTFIMVLLRLVSHAPRNEVSATSPGRAVSEFIPLTHRKASPHFLWAVSSLFICLFLFYTLISIYCEVFPSVFPITIAPLAPWCTELFRPCLLLVWPQTHPLCTPPLHEWASLSPLLSPFQCSLRSSPVCMILFVNHWSGVQKRYCRCDRTREELLPPLIWMLPLETQTQITKGALPSEGTRDSHLIYCQLPPQSVSWWSCFLYFHSQFNVLWIISTP